MDILLSAVLPTLTTLITNEIEFLGELGGELQSLKDEFQQMIDFLHGSDMLLQDHPEVRSWVDQVRDVAYDVEDVLDEFVMRCSYNRRWYGVFEKMYTKSAGAIKARHQLATRVQEIKKRLRDIAETHRRYKTQYQGLFPEQVQYSRVSRVNNKHYDKRSDALFLKEDDLVGIEVPKKEITYLLQEADLRRNVISVVGMGGLGKTTLVKKVYDDVSVRNQFDYHVWVTVSESFKPEELFRDVIIQLFEEEKKQVPQKVVDTKDIDKLKEVVIDFLQTKKYIIVFDDVWHVTHWEAIHLAFPRNQCGSRVLITTRSSIVGHASSKTDAGGYAYQFRHLPDQEAMQLFCKKAFPNSISCPQDLNQICKKILRKCEGLPLAIAVIGSYLATRKPTMEEWELFYRRLGDEMKPNNQLDAISKLISLSYYDLSPYLKNCFLHLSIFPEDFLIKVDSLVALWTAEGFVETKDGMTIEEVAEGYVNELVDRCLVQRAQTFREGGTNSIRVHDIIRHIILVKANEQNITTIVRGQKGMIFQKNVRRLTLHDSIIHHSKQGRSYCKSIRSLYIFDGDYTSEQFLSDLLSHGRKLVKVLDLKNVKLWRIPNEIFKLIHLKHLNLENTRVESVSKSIGNLQSLKTLNLTGTRVTNLPAEIQTLQHLRHLLIGYKYAETLNLMGIEVRELPAEIQILQHLRHLLIGKMYLGGANMCPIGVKACCRIGNLKSLQRLRYIEASEEGNIRIVSEIGKLVELRELGITELKMEDGKELCSSLGNLTELRVLNVSSTYFGMIDFEYLKPTYLPRLQSLTLYGRLKKYPEWISSLRTLTKIELWFSNLSDDPLVCLNDLPNLTTLKLFYYAYQGESLWFKAGGFPKLKHLYVCYIPELRCVIVEENSMPLLQQLSLESCELMKELPTGLEYLAHLQILEFIRMSDAFMNNIKNLDKEGAAYKSLVQIPTVVNYFGKLERLTLDKRTGDFKRLTSGNLQEVSTSS